MTGILARDIMECQQQRGTAWTSLTAILNRHVKGSRCHRGAVAWIIPPKKFISMMVCLGSKGENEYG